MATAASMRSPQTKHKFTALFVLAFLCLNAGGVLCLTYCGQAAKAKEHHNAAPVSHCPHHPQPPAAPADERAASASAVTCCMMPIGMIAAPLESNASIDLHSVAVAIVKTAVFARPEAGEVVDAVLEHYRPPPKDRRVDRIINQVFRI
jgi:hypothetical protein